MGIGAPRPPKTPKIKFQRGRHEGDIDWLILWGPNIPACDRALVLTHMTSKIMGFDYSERKPTFNDSFVEELENRGYDINTLRFSIEKKKAE